MAEIRAAQQKRADARRAKVPQALQLLSLLADFESRAFHEGQFSELAIIRRIQSGLRAKTANQVRSDFGF